MRLAARDMNEVMDDLFCIEIWESRCYGGGLRVEIERLMGVEGGADEDR